MTAQAFALPSPEVVDAEERGELEALTGFALTESVSDAQLDAIASDICRHLSRLEKDRARYEEAATAEMQRIKMFYASRFEKLESAINRLEEMGAEVARRAKFPGKSKSRSVAFGSYGSRKVPEKVTVVDDEKALAWARANHPYAIETKTVERLSATAVKGAVLAMVHQTGEVPDGFDHAAESEKYFIKPDA